MAIILALLLAFIGAMVAAIGALIGMGIAAFLGLPLAICVPAGAALAVLGAIVLEHHALHRGHPVSGRP